MKTISNFLLTACLLSVVKSFAGAQPDYVSTSVNTPLVINVRVNDGYGIGYITNKYSGANAVAPQHGTITILNQDSILYTPYSGYIGKDEFVYGITIPSVPQGAVDSSRVFINISDPSSNCINFAIYTATDVVNFNNDALYPVGSTLMSAGDLLIKKPYVDNTANGVPVLQRTHVFYYPFPPFTYLGSVDIDVSNSAFNCKKLNLHSTFADYGNHLEHLLIIDGDTIVKPNSTMPATYTGNGFSLINTGSGPLEYNIEITGNFDVVRFGSGEDSVYLKSVCVEECQSTPCQASFTYTTITNRECNVGIFTNTSGTSTAYWTVDDPTQKTNLIYTPNLVYKFPGNGTYNVCLAVSDSAGNLCDSICKSITITCNTKGNVITPNGDGKDDQIVFPCHNVEIYNSNGILVRKLNDSGIWDGKDNSGVLVPMGYYVGICKDTKETATVTVIR